MSLLLGFFRVECAFFHQQFLLTLQLPLDELAAAFTDESGDDDFVEDEIRLMEVEDEVELADVAEVLVEHLYELLDEFQ